jgi:hypothetical protein
MQEYTNLSYSCLIAWTETPNILPQSSYPRQVWPFEFNFLWGETLVCEWGVLCFPSSSWLLRLIPDHHVQVVPLAPLPFSGPEVGNCHPDQGSNTWMQIWLSGGSFPSLLQVVKIVCSAPFSKKKVAGSMASAATLTHDWQIRQVRFRETSLKRCTCQEAPWTIRYSMWGHWNHWKKLLEGRNSDMPVLQWWEC